jgi:hypothetical protein
VLFTTGCVLPALSRFMPGPSTPRWPLGAVAAYFAALAWLNCSLIERWESQSRATTPKPAGSVSGHDFSRAVSPAKSEWALAPDGYACAPSKFSRSFPPAILLALAGLLLAAFFVLTEPRAAALVAAGSLSALLLTLQDKTRNRMTPLALRTGADLVLLCPMALLCR